MKLQTSSRFAGAMLASLLTAHAALAAEATSSQVWTRVNDTDDAATYSAGFESVTNPNYFEQDLHDSNRAGEWCKFTFNGTGVKWIGGKNHDHGTADVFIDGKLDATVDTTAPTWLAQQELYVKAGLPDGAHELKIEIKTPGYQDFDAFEFQAQPLPLPAKMVGGVKLPDQVPYLNVPHRYPVGNGVSMGVGEASGEWTQVAGPGYTRPNFISSEKLSVEVDGIVKPLQMEMHRARATGVYYGVLKRGDLRIYLIDFARRGLPSIARLVMIDNTAKTVAHDVRVRATIVPAVANGMTNRLVTDAEGHRCGVFIQGDLRTQVMWGGTDKQDHSVVISFNDPACNAHSMGNTYTLVSKTNRIAPGSSLNLALGHSFRDGKADDAACLASIRAEQNEADLAKTITDWQAWFNDVPAAYKLSRITDDPARDLIEGGLAILKTNQSLDGGLIAHATFYKEGYVRDAILNLRGLMAAGHNEEAKEFLIWLDKKYSIYKHLPDSMECIPSLDNDEGAFNMGNEESEETALFVLAARDYYNATKDLDLLKKINATMQYSIDIQLKDAAANGYKMELNGDETEVCNAVGIQSFTPPDCYKVLWSYSSMGMCAASLDFYIKYLQLCGQDPAKYKNLITGATTDLHAELDHFLEAIHRDFWRTDLPEIPDGFHDWARMKSDNSWLARRIVNFTLMPLYWGAPYLEDEKKKDTAAIAHYFDAKTGFLQLSPGLDDGFDGHDLGYLLWAAIEVDNPIKTDVYNALVNGPTVDCWGSFNEAYDRDGHRNDHDLRSLETGVNISALARYWKLGN